MESAANTGIVLDMRRVRIWRHLLSAGGTAILLLAATCCGPSDSERKSPSPTPVTEPVNVVLVVLDTMRADALGASLGARSVTPHLDALASQSTVFESTTATAPWTVPSHGTLFTGLYPHQHGAIHGTYRLEPDHVTVAEILAQAGYLTVGFTTNPWLNARGGLGRGFAEWHEVYKQAKGDDDKGGARAVESLGSWIAGRDRARPFFAFLNLIEAHLPYEPPIEILRRHGGPGADGRRVISVEMAEDFIAGGQLVDPASLRRLYLAEVAYLDHLMGQLLVVLTRESLDQSTLLIVTSDHGEHLGEHGLTGHEFSLFEELLAVPMIIRWPRSVAAGVRRDDPVSLLDVVPTILEEAQAGGTHALPGRSLRRRSLPADVPRVLLAQYARPARLIHKYWSGKHPDVDMSRFDRSLEAIRLGRYKLVAAGTGEQWLFDLIDDPGETNDLAPARPETVHLLKESGRMN